MVFRDLHMHLKYGTLWIFLWIFSIFDFTKTSEIRQMLWTKDDTYKDLTLSSNFLWQKTTVSSVKCSVTCTSDIRCGAFFFMDADRSCLASTFVLTSPGQGVPLVGTEYYFFRPANCPSDFEYNRKTGLCIKMFFGFYNWNAAKSQCEGFAGGGLVTVRNKDQEDYLAGEIAKLGPGGRDFYIDGTDVVEEGKFIAKDGSEYSYFTEINIPADCLIFTYIDPLQLKSTHCTDSKNVICEII